MQRRSKIWAIGACILGIGICLIIVMSGSREIRALASSLPPIPTPTATTPTATTPPPTPTPTATPPSFGSTSILNGIAALSPNDMWAVGYSQSSGLGKKQSLIEHWNGKQWAIVASPKVGGDDTVLTGITAFTTTNIWAVGYYQTSTGSIYTLTEHWNGKQWILVASPNGK